MATEILAGRGPLQACLATLAPTLPTLGVTFGAMERGVVVRGKLHGRHIELDEQVDGLDGDVEVFLRPVGARPRPPDVLDVIASLPTGTRSKEDIDLQLAGDRVGWNGRGAL